MFEKKKKTFPLAEAECALWSTKEAFPSCLALKMEKAQQLLCVSGSWQADSEKTSRGFGWEEGDSVGLSGKETGFGCLVG